MPTRSSLPGSSGLAFLLYTKPTSLDLHYPMIREKCAAWIHIFVRIPETLSSLNNMFMVQCLNALVYRRTKTKL
eukprot:g49185.t1